MIKRAIWGEISIVGCQKSVQSGWRECSCCFKNSSVWSVRDSFWNLSGNNRFSEAISLNRNENWTNWFLQTETKQFVQAVVYQHLFYEWHMYNCPVLESFICFDWTNLIFDFSLLILLHSQALWSIWKYSKQYSQNHKAIQDMFYT